MSYKPRPAGSLKAAVSALVDANGGLKPAAEFLGLTTSTVFRWTDQSDDNVGRHMPAHRIRALESRCGDPIVTRFLAAEAGHLLLALPSTPRLLGVGNWNRDIADILRAAAAAATVLAADVADNGIIDRPGPAIDRIDDALALFGQARDGLVALRDGRS